MSESEKPSSSADDKELADLLDSALQDFGASKPGKNCDKPTGDGKKLSERTEADVSAQEWSVEFIQQAASQFEENFARFLNAGDADAQATPDAIQRKLQEMADAAQQVLTNPVEISDQSVEFASTISQAIQGLNSGSEGLNNPFNEEDLMKMLGGGGSGEGNDLLPFMQVMMQGLLSKEVLGPSLRDFVDKLPAYLEAHKDTLSSEDATRYAAQKRLMEEVLEELDRETDGDSADAKKERFAKVLALMQQLQDYGQPPAELVGDLEAPFNFDPTGTPLGVPGLGPTANPECCVM
ncbi:peroxisomal biogenesis factor 19 [Cylas formicarius]|uniref:peroxisomal biogenesis factor 19 n=1 Tax=Cylas formicarius TaxID=197179 RepID=UPI00295869D3|nr:peroxisomal biogenesis factor 19 [Cylas formicarius]